MPFIFVLQLLLMRATYQSENEAATFGDFDVLRLAYHVPTGTELRHEPLLLQTKPELRDECL